MFRLDTINHRSLERPRGFPLFILIHFEIKNNYYSKLKNNVLMKFFLNDFSFDFVPLLR